VHRAAAAANDQGEFARIVASLNGNPFECIDHVGVDDADDRDRRVLDGSAQAIGDWLEGGFGLGD
jgi:hypothetical protein